MYCFILERKDRKNPAHFINEREKFSVNDSKDTQGGDSFCAQTPYKTLFSLEISSSKFSDRIDVEQNLFSLPPPITLWDDTTNPVM